MQSYIIIYGCNQKVTINSDSTVHARQIFKKVFKKRGSTKVKSIFLLI